MFQKETFLRNALQKSSSKTSEQYIIYTYIYGQTLDDTFGPLVSFLLFWSTKNFITLQWTTNEHHFQVWFKLALEKKIKM